MEQRAGFRPAGPIRVLTHLRYFGYVFNPVSFYYCFEPDGKNIVAIVAEVNNTPWGERHCYVLNARSRANPEESWRWYLCFGFQAAKAMHVSPFMPMDMRYDWRVGQPRDALNLHMSNLAGREQGI